MNFIRFIRGSAITSSAVQLSSSFNILESTENYFFQNNLTTLSTGGHGIILIGNGAMVISNRDSFFQSNPFNGNVIACGPTSSANFVNPGFCGDDVTFPDLNRTNCPGLVTPIGSTGSCNDCIDAMASPMDCNGTCFGMNMLDPSMYCCLWSEMDCNGRCDQLSSLDSIGVCCLTASQVSNLCQFSCSLPCLNGGLCVGPDTCDCTGTGFTGARCDNVACGSLTCGNGGFCVMADLCNCSMTGGFYGPECRDFDCPDPCQNFGTCVGPGICSCIPGASGDQCEILTCSPNCQNGGTCVSSSNGVQCDCDGTGFGGVSCDKADSVGFPISAIIGIAIGGFCLLCFCVLLISSIYILVKNRK